MNEGIVYEKRLIYLTIIILFHESRVKRMANAIKKFDRGKLNTMCIVCSYQITLQKITTNSCYISALPKSLKIYPGSMDNVVKLLVLCSLPLILLVIFQF